MNNIAESKIIKNYIELQKLIPIKKRLRTTTRDALIFLLSMFSGFDSSKESIQFLCYHHVFDDEKIGFDRHLKFLKKHGEFISIDNAVDMLEKKKKIGGNYFCVTFDDGFKNCITNALPILTENKCPAAFFIATDYIGCDVKKDEEITRNFFSLSSDAYPAPVEFLDWNDCKQMLKAGMSIGSHTHSHRPFSKLSDEEIKMELVKSKQAIEKNLGVECCHFCCPWGRPGLDFKASIHPVLAREAGYRSFFTTERGPNLRGESPFSIKRDHMIAMWGNYQLRYFLAK